MRKYDVRLEFICNDFGTLGEDEPWVRSRFQIVAYDLEMEKRLNVGGMRVYKLNYDAMARNKISLCRAFDDLSMESSECYGVLFDKNGDLKKRFWDERYGLEGWFSRDFHFLSRIEIDERYKGCGIAGQATRIYLENFANGDDVAYLKAFPLQHEEVCEKKPYTRMFSGSLKECQSKLCCYYEKLGFRRIGKTEHFFFVVDDFLSRSVCV